MKLPRPLRIAALRALLAMQLAPIWMGAEALAQGQWVGKQTPALDLKHWFNVPAGTIPTLESLRGNLVYLEFWGTSTKRCDKALPAAQAFHNRYSDMGLRVLAVSYDAPGVLQDYIELRGFNIPIATDSTLAVYSRYLIPEVPTGCLIGADATCP